MMDRFAGETHPGRVHNDNEDTIGWDLEHNLYLVADGMGGHASGEVASRIVRDSVLESCGPSLEESVRSAHGAVVAEAERDSTLDGMGSTIVAAQLRNRSAHIVWVGDSRAYLWRGDAVRQLTRDHSFIELLRERQTLTDAEIRNHPNRNIVTQTLGIGQPTPSSTNVPLRHGDWIVLCSDGLNDELTDQEIGAAIREGRDPDGAVKKLIEGALASGGRDNVSVIIVEYKGKGAGWLTQVAHAWGRLKGRMKSNE
jgi:protein phosphatase